MTKHGTKFRIGDVVEFISECGGYEYFTVGIVTGMNNHFGNGPVILWLFDEEVSGFRHGVADSLCSDHLIKLFREKSR